MDKLDAMQTFTKVDAFGSCAESLPYALSVRYGVIERSSYSARGFSNAPHAR